MKKSARVFFVCMFAAALTVLTLASTMWVHRGVGAINEQDRMAELGTHIAKLEERVQKVVQRPTVSDWRVKESWLRIKMGMSFEQVIQILGRPTKTDMTSPDQGIWYYEGYSMEAGSTVSGNIFFANRQVLTVSPPVY